jgi:hypothetical protein
MTSFQQALEKQGLPLSTEALPIATTIWRFP